MWGVSVRIGFGCRRDKSNKDFSFFFSPRNGYTASAFLFSHLVYWPPFSRSPCAIKCKAELQLSYWDCCKFTKWLNTKGCGFWLSQSISKSFPRKTLCNYYLHLIRNIMSKGKLRNDLYPATLLSN